MLRLFDLIGVEYKYDDSAKKEIMCVFVKDMFSLQYLPKLGDSDFHILLKNIDNLRIKYNLSVVFKDFGS